MSILVMLAVVTGITFLTNCTKQEVVENTEEEIYWVPDPLKCIEEDVTDLVMLDSLNEAQANGIYNITMLDDKYIIITNSTTIEEILHHPVKINEPTTGIDEITKSVGQNKVNFQISSSYPIETTNDLVYFLNADSSRMYRTTLNVVDSVVTKFYTWGYAQQLQNEGINVYWNQESGFSFDGASNANDTDANNPRTGAFINKYGSGIVVTPANGEWKSGDTISSAFVSNYLLPKGVTSIDGSLSEYPRGIYTTMGSTGKRIFSQNLIENVDIQLKHPRLFYNNTKEYLPWDSIYVWANDENKHYFYN